VTDPNNVLRSFSRSCWLAAVSQPIHCSSCDSPEFRSSKFEVDFATDGRSASSSRCRPHPFGAHYQVLNFILPENYLILREGRPLWGEDGSVICNAITHWSQSSRIHNHTLLSHLRLPQLGGPGSHIYIPQEQGGPVMPLALGFLYVASYDSQG
jgi:hypothetical protein